MKTILKATLVAVACLSCTPPALAQVKARAARETAELLFERFGAKAGRSVPELAARIEGLAARYGDEAIVAMRKGGPSAFGLVEAAGADGARAVRVLAVHGEQGATRVLSRPAAMKQFLQHGDEAANVLVRHPGVAEPLLEKGGAQAVKALGSIDPRNGRRLAMLMEGEMANAGRHPELLGVVAKHGNGAVNFLWQNKGTLAGGAALAAFLADPEPFLSGTRDIASVAGETVVKPVVGGVFTLLNVALGVVGVLLLAVIGLAYKHGLPRAESVKTVVSLWK
ncbi:MAG: hypothetical protein K2X87_08200 [Gemmataceae bacterium]|nr:hypothetical protein [Gemmataceae bacterium]